MGPRAPGALGPYNKKLKNMLENTYNNKTSVVSPVDATFSFLRFWTSTKHKISYSKKICDVFDIFEILANVDLKLRPNNCGVDLRQLLCLLGEKCGVDLRKIICLLRPPRHIPDDPNNFKQISKTCQLFGKFWVRAVNLTTRLPDPLARPAVRPPAVFSQQKTESAKI